MRLLDFLFPPRLDEKTLRNVTSDEFLGRMSPLLVEYTHPHTTALLTFGDPVVRAAVHEAKYHGSELAFSHLGTALAEYLREADHMSRTRSVIVPVPLGHGRYRERGFNQVVEIIRHADLNFKMEPMLARTRETLSQISLPRAERAANMRGAFRTVHPADPAFTYILIDDVITTGATLQSAIDALTAGGAVHIISLALAH